MKLKMSQREKDFWNNELILITILLSVPLLLAPIVFFPTLIVVLFMVVFFYVEMHGSYLRKNKYVAWIYNHT